ncbi:hypothetical protein EPN18_02035, partial [bacterium]
KIPEEAKACDEAVVDIFELTLRLKGTLSGEHGIGMTKSKYLGMELSSGVINIMKQLKQVFDPKGILNPGKIFTIDTLSNDSVIGGSGGRAVNL